MLSSYGGYNPAVGPCGGQGGYSQCQESKTQREYFGKGRGVQLCNRPTGLPRAQGVVVGLVVRSTTAKDAAAVMMPRMVRPLMTPVAAVESAKAMPAQPVSRQNDFFMVCVVFVCVLCVRERVGKPTLNTHDESKKNTMY